MERYNFGLTGERIHLAIEGSTGGTSLGLHVAADVIEAGQRVLWASVDMPDPARFSQLFQHLSLVESSRFHAMNFGGRFDRAVDAVLGEAANGLEGRRPVVDADDDLRADFCTPGDLDGDGVVDVDDLVALLSSWGPCASCPADLNDDGIVGVDDLILLLMGW